MNVSMNKPTTTMIEPDYTDPNRYAESDAATRQLCQRMQRLAQDIEDQDRPTRHEFLMVLFAAVFLYGQLFAAWLQVIG